VRNRVAGSRTRSLVKTMVAVAGLLLVVTAHVAAAAQSGGSSTVESSMPTNIAGPLGIVVAAVGLSGLVLGLWRFLRKSAKARAAAARAEKPRTPVPSA
jgi:type IV secretory pathway VirB2 component (pilin)